MRQEPQKCSTKNLPSSGICSGATDSSVHAAIHILIIPSSHFVTPRYPLGGIFEFQQANALHNAGYQVGVIAPGVITSRFAFRRYLYPDFEQANGYPVYRRYVRKFYPQRWVRPERSIPFYQNLGVDLYQLYKNAFGKPDVMHAHNIQFAGFIAKSIHDLDAVPYVITEHSTDFTKALASTDWSGKLEACIDKAFKITAVSQAFADTILKIKRFRNIDVLHNIVDSSLFDKPLKDRQDQNENYTFLNIAEINRRKNQSSLIEAFAAHFKGKRVSLRIGGTGPLASQLKKLSRRLGVEKQVAFLGYLDRRSVLREMQGADCFVLSSLEETFGVVLIEALACGTPVIGSRCGGPEDIVNEKNGLLVAPGDTAALGAAMVQMAQSKGQYLAEDLREECRTRFGKEAFVASASRLYAKAMELR